jgi:hypothetical protein
LEIKTLHEDSLDPMFESGEANMNEVLKILDEKEAKFKQLETLSMKYN